MRPFYIADVVIGIRPAYIKTIRRLDHTTANDLVPPLFDKNNITRLHLVGKLPGRMGSIPVGEILAIDRFHPLFHRLFGGKLL